MNTKKEVYMHLANVGIYLPAYKLDQVVEELQKAGPRGFMSAIYKIENDVELKKYNDSKKGAYVLEPYADLTSEKAIQQIDKVTGKVICEYASIVEASAIVSGGKEGCANISKAARGIRNSALGFKWKFKK